MNNPYNLSPQERGITPHADFNRGINWRMGRSRRIAKQARHRANAATRLEQSRPAKLKR